MPQDKFVEFVKDAKVYLKYCTNPSIAGMVRYFDDTGSFNNIGWAFAADSDTAMRVWNEANV